VKVAVVRFPGSNCDLDVLYVLRNVLKVDANLVWHRSFSHNDFDAVFLPGGFSYGDYLRAGAIASHSPSLPTVRKMAEEGKPILGICNGFQILIEAGLLPGALLRNSCLRFVCKWVSLVAENDRTAFTQLLQRGSILRMPVAHHEGRYVNDEEGLRELEENGRVVFRYVDESGKATEAANPNSSMNNIAGICNKEGNVLGLMPHPERASEPILDPCGKTDGLLLFRSMLEFLRSR